MSKKLMIALIAGAALVVVCITSTVTAQTTQDSMVVYAQAGRINVVKGVAGVLHSSTDPGRQLSEGDELAAGDLVCTGPNGRLEVLLSPGAYLRLAENSVFQMVATDLDDVRIYLRRGSAVIEAGQGPDSAFLIQAAMPSGTVMLTKRGVYRFNVAGKRSELLVRAGETTIKPIDIKVKEGKRVAVTGDAAEPVANIDKAAPPDSLESWSGQRAEALAQANKGLNQVELAQAVGTLEAANARRGGYWVYVRQLGYSVFVPNGQTNASVSAVANSNSSDAWSGRNRPAARGIGDGPASTVVPAGARGSAGNPGTQTPGRP
jgi:hypothetical protein